MEEKQVYVKNWRQSAAEIFLCFFPAAQAVSFLAATITKDAGSSVLYLLLSLLSFWVLFLDYKVKNFFLFFLAHIPLAAILLIDAAWTVRVVCGAYIGGLIGYSFHRRYSPRENNNDAVSLLVIVMLLMALMYIACDAAGILFYRGILLTSAVFFCILYVASTHAVKVDKMLFFQNQERMDQPVYKIRRTNRIMLLCFLAAMVVFFELLLLIPWDGATGGGILISGIMTVLRWGIEAFSKFFAGGSGEESFIVEESVTDQDPSAVIGGGSPFWVWVFLEKVLYVVMPLLFLAVLGYGAYRLYKGFYGRKWQQRIEIESEQVEETQESIPQERKKRPGRFGLTLSVSNEEKVRKLFYKKVRKKMDHQIRRSDTPEQIRGKLPEENLEDLVPWYDQARYSREPIKDEDWKKITDQHS